MNCLFSNISSIRPHSRTKVKVGFSPKGNRGSIAYGSSEIAYGSSENGSLRLIRPAGVVSPRVRARVRAGLIARAHELELGLELDL